MAQVLLFGRLAEIAGWRERALTPWPATLDRLRARLGSEDATLGEALSHRSVRAVIDDVMVRGDADLAQAKEVAFLPPMSGG